jgi:hypothetical protein
MPNAPRAASRIIGTWCWRAKVTARSRRLRAELMAEFLTRRIRKGSMQPAWHGTRAAPFFVGLTGPAP